MLSRGRNHSQDLGRIGHSKIGPFILMLVFSKLLHVSGVFVCFDILQTGTLLQVISTQLLCSAIPFVLLYQPIKALRPLSKHLRIKIFLNACVYAVIMLLWGLGLRQVGPIRAVLLFDHHEMIVLACISYLFSGNDKSKSRGAMLFVCGLLMLLLLDNDAAVSYHKETDDENILFHIVNTIFDHLGVPDHKHGVLILILALLLSTVQRSYQKKLAVETGGNKKLHSLTILMSGVMLFVPAVCETLAGGGGSVSHWMGAVLPWCILVAIAVVANYLVDGISISKLDTNRVVKYSTLISFVVTLLIGYFWHGPIINIDQNTTEGDSHHHISGGVIIAVILISLSTIRLSRPSGLSHGTFIGYAETGLPMYTFDSKVAASKIVPFIKSTLKQIMENQDSRHIFYFLCINLFFCGVELMYGIWTNSLGLISDGFHMLFDCAALMVGLLAALMQKWPKTRVYSYGFARVDILSGYVNGLLLCVVAFFVFTEALGRLVDPPEVKTDRLLVVSVLGLLVNLIGIFAFSHAHSHGGVQCSGHGGKDDGGHGHSHNGSHGHSHNGGHGHSHDSGHGHSHDSGHGHSHDSRHGHSHDSGHGHSHDSGHGHSHGGGAKTEKVQNRNLQGVFLHIMADTLGSVGVILSSLFIEYFGWLRTDPLCSIVIAVLIFLSVIPLLKDSVLVLLQRIPPEKEGDFYDAVDKLGNIEHVVNVYDPHLWQYSSNVLVATVRVYVNTRANEQRIISESLDILKDHGFSECSVQVDKELYRKAIQSYGPSLLDSADKYNLGVYTRNENILSMH